VLTAVRITRQLQASRRTEAWPKVCICGERHQLLFTTSTGHPLEPRNIKRSFDSRCKRAGVRRIKIQDTRRTCGSLLAALDVPPRVAMAILRHSRIALTMDIYTQVPDKTTRAALKRLSDLFDSQVGSPAADVDHRGDELERDGGLDDARWRLLLYFAVVRTWKRPRCFRDRSRASDLRGAKGLYNCFF
jgi:Phage integrase family